MWHTTYARLQVQYFKNQILIRRDQERRQKISGKCNQPVVLTNGITLYLTLNKINGVATSCFYRNNTYIAVVAYNFRVT